MGTDIDTAASLLQSWLYYDSMVYDDMVNLECDTREWLDDYDQSLGRGWEQEED